MPVLPKPGHLDPRAVKGWMNDEELATLARWSSQSTGVVEIGCAWGRSTLALLQAAAPGSTVYCIDHWLGSPSEIGAFGPNTGFDTARATFMANIVESGLYPNAQVIEGDSQDPATVSRVPQVDMVFIDGSHSYEYVARDLELWAPKARYILCGHDWTWPGVVRAVNEYTAQARYGSTGDLVWYKAIQMGGGTLWYTTRRPKLLISPDLGASY